MRNSWDLRQTHVDRLLQRRSVIAVIFLAITVFLIGTQNTTNGFETGHHGWVSSHTLAIASHVSANSRFVGYAVQSKNTDGATIYQYFDRYPPLFSAMLNTVIGVEENSFSGQIQLAHQVMNIIFVLTMLGAFLLMKELLRSPSWAFTVVFLTFSGYYFMFYKDMIHFDQPALLGIIFLFYGIVLYRKKGLKGPVWITGLLAVSLGRGYAAVPVLFLWLLLESIALARTVDWRPTDALTAIFRSTPFSVFVVATILAFIYIGYNSAAEAELRGVGLAQTSILDSAQRRAGMQTAFASKGRKEPLSWYRHMTIQMQRIVAGLVPYPSGVPDVYKTHVEYFAGRIGILGQGIVLVTLFMVVLRFLRKRPQSDRQMYILVLLSGFMWLGPMKNLAIPHGYTTMYHLGLFLTCYAALTSLVANPLRLVLLPISAVVFVAANISVNSIHQKFAVQVNPITTDFEKIVSQLPTDANVFIAGEFKIIVDDSPAIVEGAPYASAYFLNRQYLSPACLADYIIAKGPLAPESTADGTTLTPDNQQIFLFRAQKNIPCTNNESSPDFSGRGGV